MTRPLGLAGQWATMLHWVRAEERLGAADLKVLFELLQHQCPTTGKCDPSHERIAGLTGVSRRTVVSSTNKLIAIGAIEDSRRRSGRSNVYRFKFLDLKTVARETERRVKFQCSGCAISAGKHVQPASHQKESEKEQENRSRQASTNERKNFAVWRRLNAIQKLKGQGQAKKEQDIENRLVREMKKLGLGYEQLIMMPYEQVEGIKRKLANKEIAIDEAVAMVLDYLDELTG